MIERVVGCFGRVGHGQLRLPKKPFRTRRYLHHAFWSHGAGNIDLPPWWKFLLQQHDKSNLDSNQGEGSLAGVAAAGLHKIFLELLYPVQTRALIRRLDRVTKSQRQEAQLALRGSREFTSIAKGLLNGTSGIRHVGQNGVRSQTGNATSTENPDSYNQTAEALLGNADDPGKLDQLWKLQQDSFEAANPLDIGTLREIFFQFSASQRKIDLERSLALFETFQVKTPILYDRAVRAALGLKDSRTAADIHLEASTSHPASIDIGTPAILNYAIIHGRKRLAVEVWYRLWQSKILYYSTQRDLWREVDTMPLQRLLVKAEQAAKFAVRVAKLSSLAGGSGPSQNTVIAAREFALAMTERAFEIRGSSFNQNQYIRLLNKIVDFGDSTKIRLQALRQLLSLNTLDPSPTRRGQNQRDLLLASIGIYQQLRQDPDFVPPRSLLEDLFTVLKLSRNYAGMLMILEDWKRFSTTKIPMGYYVQTARTTGGAGQVAAADQVFESFISDYPFKEAPQIVRSQMVNYGLWAHLKRADTASIVKKFEFFQEEHGFTPDTTSYNLIIMTFARVGDVDGAMGWFQSLQDNGLVPEPRTYSSLMSMYARRGDLDAVQDIWREIEQKKIRPERSMIDALVVANTHDERFEEAEELVEKAVNMALEGSGIHMWNVLLNAYALRGDLGNVTRLHQRMQTLKVGEDASTYAALLLSLCITGNLNSATAIFTKLMPRLRVPRTRMHYATLMAGCVHENRPELVFALYRDMVKKKLVPDTGIHNTLLRAAVVSDERENQDQNVDQHDLRRAREVLDITLKSFDRAQFASRPTLAFRKTDPVDQASITSSYGYMIHIYGLKASFTKVNELFDEYIAAAKGTNQEAIIGNPPSLMLSALLTAHIIAGNDEEVDRCWSFALEKFATHTKRSKASSEEAGWVLPYRRFLINPILRKYMKHLKTRGRLDDMINIVKELRRAGYDLHGPNWNSYVTHLASSNNPAHVSLAFEICENELMQGWPGWRHLSKSPDSTSDRIRTAWRLKRAFKRANHGAARQAYKRTVRYETLVQLAGVYAGLSSSSQEPAEGKVTREELQGRAPITVDAVQRLPRIRDNYQDMYLRS